VTATVTSPPLLEAEGKEANDAQGRKEDFDDETEVAALQALWKDDPRPPGLDDRSCRPPSLLGQAP
jgi:hypothetical protein